MTIDLNKYPENVKIAIEYCINADPGTWQVEEDVVWEMQETDGYVDGQVNFYSGNHLMMVRFMENVPYEVPNFKILAENGEDYYPDTVEELVEIFQDLSR
jgi:hypothetical protein